MMSLPYIFRKHHLRILIRNDIVNDWSDEKIALVKEMITRLFTHTVLEPPRINSYRAIHTTCIYPTVN